MPSAKQQPSNVKHGGAIRPNVWVLTFGPPCIFLELLLFMFYATPISLSREFCFGFQSPDLPCDVRFWTRGFLLVMRSRKAGFPFAVRARKRGFCPQRYVSKMTLTENCLSQNFSLNPLFSSVNVMSRKYFAEEYFLKINEIQHLLNYLL